MGNYTDENTVNDVIDILQKQFGVKEMVIIATTSRSDFTRMRI